MGLHLDTPVQFVKNVGPGRAAHLAKQKIYSAGDLLKYRPFRYEDRTGLQTIGDLTEGQPVAVQGEVVAAGDYPTARRRVSIFELQVEDPSGRLPVKFFNQPYLSKVFRPADRVILFGTPQYDKYSRSLAMFNPEFEILDDGESQIHTGRIVPIYRKIGPLTTRALRSIMFGLLERLEGPIPDPIPRAVARQMKFPERLESFGELHFPSGDVDLEELDGFQRPHQQRFIFEEFFLFHLGLQIVRQNRQLLKKERRIETSPELRRVLKSILPFRPTTAQKRVLKEIVEDLRAPAPMHRLLQGDVGSGKTIVALQALVIVIGNGYQTALMAPTEILAEQHYRKIRSYLSKTGYRIGFLSSSVKGKERKKLLDEVSAGKLDLLIGTHAVIQDQVRFKDLGMAVVDEQHRFGVVQRSEMMEKGSRPDILVMTATPIPRSLALTVYGDLSLSILDEMPPGRQPIRTVIKAESSRGEVYNVLARELAKGRQAYVVYPLVEESEKVDLRAATEMHAELEKAFDGHKVGLLHGRLKPERKDSLMQAFASGEIDLLVATTVIEVGIDVANATIMVIEHAERFGLSQLHQLRGRIGRGRHPGLCILLVDRVKSKEAYERLEIMRRTSDGFRIAEKDLEIRGPGEFVGTRQSGIPQFLFGNIVRDRELLEIARREAEKYLKRTISRSQNKQSRLRQIAAEWRKRYGLFEVG